MTIDPSNIVELFRRAKAVYNQRDDTFYITSKNISGLHLAVFPHRDDYVFSSYNFGDDDDVRYINNLWRDRQIYKTFGCTLCPIKHHDNAVIISDTQNQLYVDANTPALQIQSEWISSNHNVYIITGTVPQYYYNHLLFVSETHIPTYNMFIDEKLFHDVFEYLKVIYRSDSKVTALFNGSFGSDIYHFHIHLTNQHFSVIEHIWNKVQTVGLLVEVIEYGIIRGITILSTDVNELYTSAYRIAIKYFVMSQNRDAIALTANFGAKEITLANGKKVMMNMVFFHLTTKQNYTKTINDCVYMLMPTNYTVKANCFNIPPAYYNQFSQDLSNAFDNVYIKFDSVTVLNDIYDVSIDNLFYYDHINSASDLDRIPVEKLYTMIPPTNEPIHMYMDDILNILNAGGQCYTQMCTWDYNAKYQYLLGIYIINLDESGIVDFLHTVETAHVRIHAIMNYLDKYNGTRGDDMIRSDYLYFKGAYLVELLRKTFNNLILVSNNSSININEWINYIFERIGESSASGTNTVSKLYYEPKIEFLMKIMKLDSVDKVNEFNHEFFTSLKINDIRNYVPNYILCYGGTTCGCNIEYSKDNISNIGLCDNTQQQCSYILLEYIKNAHTVGRMISLPNLVYETEADDYADMMLQIFTSLMYGQYVNKFTHYDLHKDNVMAFDFIRNANYLKMFKIWDEYSGTKVPFIRTIYFVYHILSQNGRPKPIIIPSKYLYIIIDYGSAYVDGLATYNTFPNRVKNIGMTSDRTKSIADVYTFSMSLMLNIMIFKPYLIFNNNTWTDNKLSRIFQKVLLSYRNYYNNVYEILEHLPALSNRYTKSRYRVFKDYMNSCVKPEFKVTHFQYIHKDFTPDYVADDFNDAVKVVSWIYDTLYNNDEMERHLNDPDVYVFNWGGPLLPQNVLQGIKPNTVITELIDTRRQKQAQSIAKVREYIASIR